MIRYGHRKQYPSDARAMALEYGAAAHEVFAAIYLWQVGFIQNLPEHMHYHATRIFKSPTRFAEALKTKDASPDQRDHLISLGFNILHSGSFFDDPWDTIRTVNNLEVGIIKYVDNVLPSMPDWPIWIADLQNPEAIIGVECSFDIELERTINLINTKPHRDTSVSRGYLRGDETEVVRYIGQLDRLHDKPRKDTNVLILGENKTGSRLGDSWRLSFDMSHQATGYMLAAYTLTGRECVESRVHGLKNKQTGHSDDFSPISPLFRTQETFETFIDWAIYSKNVLERYKDDWENAPRFAHSCDRYFRPCSLIPFCCDTPEGRIEQFNEMVQADMSPSERAVMDKIGLIE
ncbi:MAG: hypothetical protein MN733_03330 [Nitrososphaera sp.]|nr:hypothetical protein [Nitrososphaera sp.]